jgi:hypothetical protein
MLGSVGKGWSPEASECTVGKRLSHIRRRCVTIELTLTLWSKVSRNDRPGRRQSAG